DPSIGIVDPFSKGYYKGRKVTLGLDYEGHGEEEEASQTTITFWDEIAFGVSRWLYAKTWDVGTPPHQIREEIVAMCRYFRPKGGAGDAYGASELYELNLALYKVGLTKINVGRLQNKAGKGGWDEFFIVPIRHSGPQKHTMYKQLQLAMHSRSVIWPLYLEGYPGYEALGKFLAQLENIKAKRTTHGYDSFSMIRPKLGDDFVDSGVTGLWAQGSGVEAPEAYGGSVKPRGFRSQKFSQGQKFRSR
ncbi:hypothetical protein LCGC14_2805180, partial [marine sediment metagenome]